MRYLTNLKKTFLAVVLASLSVDLGFAAVGAEAPAKTVKWHPKVRVSKVLPKETLIPMEALKPFIKESLVFNDEKYFLNAPRVIAEDKDRIVGGIGSLLYVRGLPCEMATKYHIYRAGKMYKHPITGEKLGFEALDVGEARLKVEGQPATFEVVKSNEAIRVGDRLLSNSNPLTASYLTVTPASSKETGFILSARDGVRQIGKNQVVLISLGTREGLVPGNTLDIMKPGGNVVDPESKGWRKCIVQLPDERVGHLLIFQVYEKLSLGLITESTEIISVLDKVKSPNASH